MMNGAAAPATSTQNSPRTTNSQKAYLGIDRIEFVANVGHDNGTSLRIHDFALAIGDLGRGPNCHGGVPRQEGSGGGGLGCRRGRQERLLW